MATKKTNPTKKTPKKATKKTSTKTVKTVKTTKPKTVVKAEPKAKTVHKVEPYHPGFGAILLVVCIIMAVFLLISAVKDIVISTFSDAQRFSMDYTKVETDNVYKTKTAEEIIAILEHGTGVVFLGFPSCPWCQAYAPMLNDLAKEYGVEEIAYYDVLEDRQNDTENYKKMVSLLSDYLQYDENGAKRIFVPETAFVVDGEIIGNDLETSKDTLGLTDPEKYWTEEHVAAWKEKVGKLFKIIKEAEGCKTSCND